MSDGVGNAVFLATLFSWTNVWCWTCFSNYLWTHWCTKVYKVSLRGLHLEKSGIKELLQTQQVERKTLKNNLVTLTLTEKGVLLYQFLKAMNEGYRKLFKRRICFLRPLNIHAVWYYSVSSQFKYVLNLIHYWFNVCEIFVRLINFDLFIYLFIYLTFYFIFSREKLNFLTFQQKWILSKWKWRHAFILKILSILCWVSVCMFCEEGEWSLKIGKRYTWVV